MLDSLLVQNHNFDNKVILLRSDLNLPLKHNTITDRTRLQRLIPTIQYLRTYNSKIVIISHFKQPKTHDTNFSMKFLVNELEQLLKIKVHFVDDCIGEKVEQTIKRLPEKSVVLLENLRFYRGEEKNDLNFAKKLARVADLYINDAFSCCHRNHASIVKITELLPSLIGINIQNELNYLKDILQATDKPLGLIIGGSKISTKIEILSNMVKKVDFLIIGGAMANNFLLAQKVKIGQSLHEISSVELAKKIFEEAEKYSCKIILPIDHVVARNINDTQREIRSLNDVDDCHMILDIGPKTIKSIIEILPTLKSVLWNGPLGAFEYKNFDKGTLSIAKSLSELTQNNGLKTIVGGGDSIAAISKANLTEQHFTYISTGGGALLQFLSGKKLPGLQALKLQ